MLQHFIRKVHENSWFNPSPRVLVSVPCLSTEVEKQLKNVRIPVSTITSTENFEDYPTFYEQVLEEDMAEVEA